MLLIRCRIRSWQVKFQKLDLLFTFNLLYRWWRQIWKNACIKTEDITDGCSTVVDAFGLGGVEHLAVQKYKDTNPVANNWKNEKETGL